MNVTLAPEPLVKEDFLIWHEQTEHTDASMDLATLSLRAGTVERLISFHVLEKMYLNDVRAALINWRSCLKPGASLFIVVDDFEYVARALVGGDINVEIFNTQHAHPMNFSREYLAQLLVEAGFKETNIKVWFSPVPNLFDQKHYELVIEAVNV